jgi:hypothetical protein
MHSLGEPLSRDGQFWLPSSPDRTCFGQLIFDPKTGIELSLFGSLRSLPDSFNIHDVPDGLLHGRLENGAPVSLFGTFRKSHRMTFGNGFPRETYRSNLAAIGVHVQSGNDKQFTSAVFEPTGLREWLGRDWYPSRALGDEGRTFSVQTQPPKNDVILKNNTYSVLVNRFSSINQDQESVSITPKADIEIRTNSPQSINGYVRKSSALVSFLSFCLAQQSEIQFITVRYEAEGEFEGSGPQRYAIDLVYARIDHGSVKADRDALAPYSSLTTPRIVLREWMALYAKAKDSIRLVHEVQSDHVKYVNLRFLMAAQAAEAFHREAFGPKKLTLNRRLEDLVNRLTLVIGYTPRGLSLPFRQKTVRTRNYNTHFSAPGKRLIFNSAEMYWVSQRLAAMITILALDKIGIDHSVIRRQIGRRDEISRILQASGTPY